jgi:MFS family permease
MKIDVCMQLSTLNLGIFLAYWIDYGFTQSQTGSYTWRVPCILQCIFLIPMLFLLLVVPETPRWLASHAAPSDSLDVLRRLHSYHRTDEEITALHSNIVKISEYEKSLGAGSWHDLLANDEIQSQRRFLIACAIQAFQQLGGINALIYYSNTLFSASLGFSDHLSALMSGFLQTWFFVASFIPWFLIDRIGRRPLLLSCISFMSAIMVVQTGLIYNVQNKTSIAKGCGIGAAVMLFLFEGAFTIGFQATVWVYPSEILPLRLRQRGSGVSTACKPHISQSSSIFHNHPPSFPHSQNYSSHSTSHHIHIPSSKITNKSKATGS